MLNRIPLNYWKLTGYSREDIDDVMREIDNTMLAARIEFKENNNVHFTITNRVEKLRAGHAPTCIRFIHDLVSSYGSGRLRGTVVLWLEDGMWEWHERFSRRVPILAFGRRCADHRTMLVPDPAFLGSKGYLNELEEIKIIDAAIPWHKKKPTAFWRGATTGIGLQDNDFEKVPRIALSLKSKELNNIDKLDASISHVTDFDHPTRKQEILELGIVKPYCEFNDFLKYRYLIDVDGHSCAWKSLFLKLASRCLVLKTESPFMQWYYDKLVPWVNYVPLNKDYQDIEDILAWLPVHDKEAKEIADNGTELAKSITYDAALKDIANLLESLLACQR